MAPGPLLAAWAAAVLLPAGVAAQAARPAFGPARWRVEAGVALASRLIEDANGATVRPAVAPAAGAGVAWDVGPRTAVGLGARGSIARVRIEDRDGERGAGRSWQADLLAALEQRVLGCADAARAGCLAVRLGAGVVLLSGPDDLAPFRDNGGARPPAEGAAVIRVANGRPLFASVAAQAYRLDAVAGDPRADPGTASRLLIGVRYGR